MAIAAGNSWLLSFDNVSGVLNWLSDALYQVATGGSSITMTLDLYSHLAPGLQEAAAASLNGLLKKEKGPVRKGQSNE